MAKLRTQRLRHVGGGVLGGSVFRSLRLLGAIGPPFELQNDRSLDETVEESHCQRSVRKVVSPFIKIDVGHQRRGAFLVT